MPTMTMTDVDDANTMNVDHPHLHHKRDNNEN